MILHSRRSCNRWPPVVQPLAAGRATASAAERVHQRRGNVAVVADHVRAAVAVVSELPAELDVALARDVDQDVQARGGRRQLAGIRTCVVDAVAEEDDARILFGHAAQLASGELEWEREVRKTLRR